MVDPLVRVSALGKIMRESFNPIFRIRGTSVVLHPLEMVSIPVDRLGSVVATLSEQSQLNIAAQDELFTRARK